MISSLLIINTINKTFGKHGAETTTSQKCHNLTGRRLLSGKPGIIIYARSPNRKENLLKEEFWIPNHKHVALYGFVFFSVACSWNNTAPCFGCPAEVQCHHSCRQRGFGMLQLSMLLPCWKEPTPQSWKREHTVSLQIQVPHLKACLQVAWVKTSAHEWSSTELAPVSKITASGLRANLRPSQVFS